MPARNALETTGLYLTLPNIQLEKIDRIVHRARTNEGTLTNRQTVIRQLIVEALENKKYKEMLNQC